MAKQLTKKELAQRTKRLPGGVTVLTMLANHMASIPPGNTGLRGVRFDKESEARIKAGKDEQQKWLLTFRGAHLGYYTDPQDAAKAFDAAANKAFGKPLLDKLAKDGVELRNADR